MQSGRIFRKGPSWFLRYYRDEFVGGQAQRVRVCVRLARYSDAYRNKKDLAPLVATHLSSSGETRAELSLTVSEYVQSHYFPTVTNRLKPSTLRGYQDIFKLQVKSSSLSRVRLRDIRTSTLQAFLDSLQGSHQSLLLVRSFLSGVFSHARRSDVWTAVNPLMSVRVGGKKTKPIRHAYSVEEIQHMLTVLPEPARTVVGVAAFTGLRKGEIRGLRWEDYDGDKLNVQRSVWRTHVGETKSVESSGAVPVIPLLRTILAEHLSRCRGRAEKHNFIFSGDKKGFALHLDNLYRRVISPALTSCKICGKVGSAHEGEKHEYQPDEMKTRWHGWHAFRRGLGTNLAALGVPVKTIQEILRHSEMATTAKHYIIIDGKNAARAMKKMQRAFERKPRSGQQVGNEIPVSR
jgi:integrase